MVHKLLSVNRTIANLVLAFLPVKIINMQLKINV